MRWLATVGLALMVGGCATTDEPPWWIFRGHPPGQGTATGLIADMPVGISPGHPSAVPVRDLGQLHVVALTRGALWHCPVGEGCEQVFVVRRTVAAHLGEEPQARRALASALDGATEGALVVIAVSGVADEGWERSLQKIILGLSLRPWLLRFVDEGLVRIEASEEALAPVHRRSVNASPFCRLMAAPKGPRHPGASPSPSLRAKKRRGSLSRDDIEAALRTRKGRVRSCYVEHLSTAGGGKIVYGFVIDSEGRTTQACIRDDTMASLSVNRCVIEALQDVRYPKPRGGGSVVVNYPFLFSRN